MPTYEYECTSCGNRVEVFQRLAEDPLTTCERCGGRLRKLFHPVGISFKGSGFYSTDSRSGNGQKKKPAAEKTAEKKDSSSTSSTKKDSTEGSSTKKDSTEGSSTA